MQLSHIWRAGILSAALCWYAGAQAAPAQNPPAPSPPGKDAPAAAKDPLANEGKGVPPRSAPTDYYAHAKVGKYTMGAEFSAHAVPTPEGVFSNEDYVVVEVGFYGPPGARLKLNAEDFTLRINNKRTPLSTKPFGLVFSSLKDPSWEPPEPVEAKSKTGINTGGGGNAGDPPPTPPKMPFPLRRAMEQHVSKAALPQGDRLLPQAGLIFFAYHGKDQGIKSLELTYAGPAGKVFMALHP